MTPQNKALARIVTAGQRLREAADRWNAVDLSAIGSCCSALESTADDLRDAAGILKGSPVTSGDLVRSGILDLKKSVFRIERLVGASAAFLRSVPGPAREDSGFYGAGGSIYRTAPAAEARGMQV
jgi:hypothetical protein